MTRLSEFMQKQSGSYSNLIGETLTATPVDITPYSFGYDKKVRPDDFSKKDVPSKWSWLPGSSALKRGTRDRASVSNPDGSKNKEAEGNLMAESVGTLGSILGAGADAVLMNEGVTDFPYISSVTMASALLALATKSRTPKEQRELDKNRRWGYRLSAMLVPGVGMYQALKRKGSTI